MRYILSVSVVVMSASFAFGQAEGTASQGDGLQEFNEILNGRSAVARLYRDPQDDPEKFERFGVPIANGQFLFTVVKSIYPPVPDSALVLVLAEDQADTSVATALGPYAHAVQGYF